MEKGYLYAALGESCFREAIISATSLRRVTPHAHITLVTDQDASGFYCFDSVIVKQPVAISDCQHINGRYYKITSMIESPYQQTLFLDTDTYLCDQVLEIFRLLDFCDLCMVPAPRHLRPESFEDIERKINTMMIYRMWMPKLQDIVPCPA